MNQRKYRSPTRLNPDCLKRFLSTSLPNPPSHPSSTTCVALSSLGPTTHIINGSLAPLPTPRHPSDNDGRRALGTLMGTANPVGIEGSTNPGTHAVALEGFSANDTAFVNDATAVTITNGVHINGVPGTTNGAAHPNPAPQKTASTPSPRALYTSAAPSSCPIPLRTTYEQQTASAHTSSGTAVSLLDAVSMLAFLFSFLLSSFILPIFYASRSFITLLKRAEELHGPLVPFVLSPAPRRAHRRENADI
ncbi:hypothetical protein D9619_011138 [Psilocybe cf. subviscida]|uniref:Uncharacterized protein n=1 Tax=Psilocybe cf. subviscida TaxID=2480587 RepID=A0A8H5BIZ8_9AGAR|nr:hypothetical protein D9619_011138 [Psilocybe cf. subviscida]